MTLIHNNTWLDENTSNACLLSIYQTFQWDPCFLYAWFFVQYSYQAFVHNKGIHVIFYRISVEPEDLKKLGSALNALSNEKSKQQKVGEIHGKQSWLVNQLISILHIID